MARGPAVATVTAVLSGPTGDRRRRTVDAVAAPPADGPDTTGAAGPAVTEQQTAVATCTADACDGFMLNFPILPDGLEAFVQNVVPELQRRGIFRTDYTGVTLRDTLGLARPANRHTTTQSRTAE